MYEVMMERNYIKVLMFAIEVSFDKSKNTKLLEKQIT